MFSRVHYAGLNVTRPEGDLGRYRSIPHHHRGEVQFLGRSVLSPLLSSGWVPHPPLAPLPLPASLLMSPPRELAPNCHLPNQGESGPEERDILSTQLGQSGCVHVKRNIGVNLVCLSKCFHQCLYFRPLESSFYSLRAGGFTCPAPGFLSPWKGLLTQCYTAGRGPFPRTPVTPSSSAPDCPLSLFASMLLLVVMPVRPYLLFGLSWNILHGHASTHQFHPPSPPPPPHPL